MRAVFNFLFFFSGVCLLQGQSINLKSSYPVFPIGPSGIYATIEPGLLVTVKSLQPGTPAAEVNLKPGDVIEMIGGDLLNVPDPRVVLGKAIGRAEAGSGDLVMGIKRGEAAVKVAVKLPVLGAYHVEWPLNCRKSRSIVTANANYLAGGLQEDGSYHLDGTKLNAMDLKASLASLFLLSTGDPDHLPAVARHAQNLAAAAESRRNAGGHVNWQLGYQGIFLGEYYLRTGDKSVLKGLKEICNWAVENQAAGAWGHGNNPGAGYVQSGLMNHTSVPIVAALTLARECGVKFDEDAYVRAVKFMYRMAGHGCVPYGDHRSELGWSNTNGRNAMLACAFSLLEEPRFQKAKEHLATLVADSYHQPEFGHTGGGFNVMWRGLASIHVPRSRQSHYQRQMEVLAWYYDLARQSNDGFYMLATPPTNTRYAGPAWGACMGLTYSAPLKHLRIAGAPRGKHSRNMPKVDFNWGTDEDLIFLSTGDAEGFEKEAAPHEVYHLLIGKDKKKSTVNFAAQHLLHYSPLVRTWAGRRLRDVNDEASLDALAKAANHSDPRVRRAVYDAISGYDNWGRPFRSSIASETVSSIFLTAILKTLHNPKAAWWEIDGALFALGRAEPGDIRENLPLILKYSKHEEWYLREAAFWAIVGLHKTITPDEFMQLANIYAASSHVFARSSYDAGFRTILRTDRVALDRMTLAAAGKTLGETVNKPSVMLGYGTGGIHEAAHRTMMLLKHFDPEVYRYMIDDFVAYLDLWEPYYQHSGWLITGSKWQPGIPKILEGLGAEGEPIVAAMRRVLARFDTFDQRKVGNKGVEMKAIIESAVGDWEKRNGAR